MIRPEWIARVLGASLVTMFFVCLCNAQVLSSANLMPTTTHAPDEFGTQDYTVTTIPAVSFVPASDQNSVHTPYGTSYNLFRYNVAHSSDEHYYAGVSVPAGAVIDYIGLETETAGDSSIGVALYAVDRSGNSSQVAAFSSTLHDFDTDYNSTPIGVQVIQNAHNALILDVEIAEPTDFDSNFGWVEVWWRRTVSTAPPAATFNDVPTSHPFFQFIEALKASGITGGCQASPPLYCPDAPVTRGQMAVFLAKALGLHWGL
jgi:hypothetical protein